MLIEEWDQVQDFHAYAQFRAETGDTQKLLAMTVSDPQVGARPARCGAGLAVGGRTSCRDNTRGL